MKSWCKWLWRSVPMVLLCLSVLGPGDVCGASRKAAEYEVKAAYLYKFLLFVRCPTEGLPLSASARVVIGILGQDPFGDSFKGIEGKPVGEQGRTLEIRRYGRYREATDLRDCKLLFIARSEQRNMRAILASLRRAPVLTVSDTPGFLDAGGMVYLVLDGERVRWEINRTPLSDAELWISSQLLRNASRVIDAEPGD